MYNNTDYKAALRAATEPMVSGARYLCATDALKHQSLADMVNDAMNFKTVAQIVAECKSPFAGLGGELQRDLDRGMKTLAGFGAGSASAGIAASSAAARATAVSAAARYSVPKVSDMFGEKISALANLSKISAVEKLSFGKFENALGPIEEFIREQRERKERVIRKRKLDVEISYDRIRVGKFVLTKAVDVLSSCTLLAYGACFDFMMGAVGVITAIGAVGSVNLVALLLTVAGMIVAIACVASSELLDGTQRAVAVISTALLSAAMAISTLCNVGLSGMTALAAAFPLGLIVVTLLPLIPLGWLALSKKKKAALERAEKYNPIFGGGISESWENFMFSTNGEHTEFQRYH